MEGLLDGSPIQDVATMAMIIGIKNLIIFFLRYGKLAEMVRHFDAPYNYFNSNL